MSRNVQAQWRASLFHALLLVLFQLTLYVNGIAADPLGGDTKSVALTVFPERMWVKSL